jgi:hypothetical protein
MARQAANADIQKAAKGQPDEHCENNLDGQHRQRSSALSKAIG